jgi:hypothetical protein
LVYTDLATAQAEYTFVNDNPTTYPPDFVQVFALLLAVYIAPRITGGDQFKLGQRAQQLYQWKLQAAQVNAFQELQDDMLPDSEQILARDNGFPNQSTNGYGDCR